MSFLGKLFGKKPASATPTVTAGASVSRADSADPAKDPNMIRVFDAYGRAMFITKQVWRDSVLVDHIKKVWDKPDDLYGIIVQSLRDGFGAYMIKPAEHLAAIDPVAERGAIILAIIYREQKRLDDSENVLRRYLAKHGESGVALNNLAKVHSDRGDEKLSQETLWRALQLDPNQDNGFGWYAAIHREKDGDAGALAAFRRIAALPGSWRAQLWLARDALQRRQLDEAMALYAEAFARAARPVPTDMLQQVSGDLGNNGHLPEILRLTEPVFQIEVHGLAVGNNLIKANLDLGRIDAARALLDQHYAQNRPDWKESLAFWNTEIAKTHITATPAEPTEKLSVAMLTIDGPIWLPEKSAAHELFPARTGDPERIAFLGCSAETPGMANMGGKPAHQLSDAPGRLSRAIPLFLAEHVQFGAHTAVRTMIPWIQTGGFVLSGPPWKDADAAQCARQGEPACDYVVVTHINATAEPWQVTLRFIRTIDAQCLATAAASFRHEQPQTGLPALAQELLQLVAQHADVVRAPAPTPYSTPTNDQFPYYLLRLEQLLAVRCSTMDGVPAGFLSGEREIIDGNLQLCLQHPRNVIVRILLVQTVASMKRTRPAVVAEFREKLQLLHRDHTLAEPAQAIVQCMLADAITP